MPGAASRRTRSSSTSVIRPKMPEVVTTSSPTCREAEKSAMVFCRRRLVADAFRFDFGGEGARTIVPDEVLLFRYSALTFNGHRIHYDKPYATGVEMYPGLVVHGPMQATMLYHFAAKLRGRAPAGFAFRSLSTLFDDTRFTLNATDENGALTLWTARPGGPVAADVGVSGGRIAGIVVPVS